MAGPNDIRPAPVILTDLAGVPYVAGGGGGGGGPITVADGADIAQGSKGDAAATDIISAWTVVSLLKGLWAQLAATLKVSVANGADVTQGASADAAYTGTGPTTVIAALKGIFSAPSVGTYSTATAITALTPGNNGSVQLDTYGNARGTVTGARMTALTGQNLGYILPADQASNASANARPLGTLAFVAGAASLAGALDFTAASGTTGAGIPAAGMLGWDGTAARRALTDADGAQSVRRKNTDIWSGTLAFTTATTQVGKVAGAAGIRNYLTSLQLSWAATTAATTIQIQDGAGAVLWNGAVPTGAGMSNIVFDTPLKGSVATALNVVSTVAPGSAVQVNLQGYQAA